MGCTANSEMVRQLVRRAQLLSPLPYHRTQGLTRHQMLETAFAHLDVDGSGELEAHEIMNFCRGVNPTNTEDELREMLVGLSLPGVRFVTWLLSSIECVLVVTLGRHSRV